MRFGCASLARHSMSGDSQFGAETQPPKVRVGCVVLAVVLLIVLPMVGLVCAGVLGGVFYLRMRNDGATISDVLEGRPPILGTQRGQTDWFADRLLSAVYTTALDAVATNSAVLERLGSPIEPVNSGDEGAFLFRRLGVGEMNPAGEQIEFEVRGPKGRGTVLVVAMPPDSSELQGRAYEYRVSKISIKIGDSEELEVLAPMEQPAVMPIR